MWDNPANKAMTLLVILVEAWTLQLTLLQLTAETTRPHKRNNPRENITYVLFMDWCGGEKYFV